MAISSGADSEEGPLSPPLLGKLLYFYGFFFVVVPPPLCKMFLICPCSSDMIYGLVLFVLFLLQIQVIPWHKGNLILTTKLFKLTCILWLPNVCLCCTRLILIDLQRYSRGRKVRQWKQNEKRQIERDGKSETLRWVSLSFTKFPSCIY